MIHLSFWLCLWIRDNSQNSGWGLCEIGRTEWSLESKERTEEEVQNKRCVQKTRFYLFKQKISRIISVSSVLMMSLRSLPYYLALATHSMTASFLPTVTLVFFGGTMMEGAMGSAGPPTSRKKWKKSLKHIPTFRLILCICLIQPPWAVPDPYIKTDNLSLSPACYHPTINTPVFTLDPFCSAHSIFLSMVLAEVLEAIM